MVEVEYRTDSDGYDVRYVDGMRQGRVPHSDICDDQTEYVIRWVNSDENSEWWEYRHLGSGYGNIDELIPTIHRLPELADKTRIQILLNFGRVEETFGMERVQYLFGSDVFLPVYRLEGYKERTLNMTYQQDMGYPVLDSEPSARGEGESPADIEPRVFESLLDLIDNSERIRNWHETWSENTTSFQRGEFYDRIYAPLFAAYSVVDEEVVELVNRYHIEKGNDKEQTKSFIMCGFNTKLCEIFDILTHEEKETILQAWRYRNDLIHGIHSRFGVKIMDIDLARLSKQLLFSIMKLRTLNAYVNSARYRPGVQGPRSAVAHLMGTSGLGDAVEAAREAVADERYFQFRFIDW